MDTQWILHRIAALGMTQTMLAGKLGLTRSGLSLKLHNHNPTTLQEATILAGWLRLTPDEVAEHLLNR